MGLKKWAAVSLLTGQIFMARILFIERDESQRLLFHEELIEEGYEVLFARNGKEAWQSLEEASCDLVIMDISSLTGEGADRLRKIRKRYKNVPWIAQLDVPAYKQHPLACLADASLVKSSDLSLLKETIKRLLAEMRNEITRKP